MGIAGERVCRIAHGWDWLCRHPNHRAADERYERWLGWVEKRDPDESLSPRLAAIAASLDLGFALDQSEHATNDWLRPCPECGVPVWRVMARHAGAATRDDGTLVLLNHQPTAHGRFLMTAPGIVRWCNVIDLTEWPLPRYTSHFVDCVVMIRKREIERDEMAAQMRWAKAERAENTKRHRERKERYFARIDGQIGASP